MRVGEFYRGLASLLRAGVVMREALRALRESRTLDAPIGDALEQRVAAGAPLSEGLRLLPDLFPAEDAALLEAGETTGRIEQCLDRLATLEDERRRRAKEAAWQCRLPLLNLHAAALLLPAAFLGLHGRLTFDRWLGTVALVLGPLYAAIALLWRMRRTARGRARLRRWIELVPGFGAAARHHRRARFASVLEAAYESGMPIDRGVALAGRAVDGLATDGAESVIRQGGTLVAALSPLGLFTAPTLGTLSTAEQAGDLSGTLRRVAAEEAESGERLLRLATDGFAKLLGIAVLLVVAAFILQFFFEYYGRAGGLLSR